MNATVDRGVKKERICANICACVVSNCVYKGYEGNKLSQEREKHIA